MIRLAMVAPALMLSACASVPPPEPAGQQPTFINGGNCRTDGLARFNGQPANERVAAEMLRVSGARTIRWVAPGMAVTMDYQSDRLTVSLDSRNRVEGANCG